MEMETYLVWVGVLKVSLGLESTIAIDLLLIPINIVDRMLRGINGRKQPA